MFFCTLQGARLELVNLKKRKEEQAKREIEKQVNTELKESLRKYIPTL